MSKQSKISKNLKKIFFLLGPKFYKYFLAKKKSLGFSILRVCDSTGALQSSPILRRNLEKSRKMSKITFLFKKFENFEDL